MRFRVTSLFVAAALVVAAPAYAQRASLADRVAVLEQQQANRQANNDLLNQLQQARSDLQALRATVEQLQHDNEQLKQQSKDQYLDLDGRLNRLEGAGGATTPSLPPATGGATPAPAARPAAAATSEKAPIVHGDPGTQALSNDERTAYNVAFNALKSGKYDDASQLFQSFLALYPNGVYTPNALYWLGESYYATRNFQLAEVQFRDLVSRYPTHDKSMGGLLKLGLSQYGEGKNNEAQQTLQQVASQYPGSDAARVAQERLQSLRLGQQLR